MRSRLCLCAGAGLLLLLSGCSALLPAREVQELQLIETLGLDGVPGDLTVSASSGPSVGDAPSLRLAARGESIERALRNMQDYSPREELFFAHIQYVLAGEDTLRGGVSDLLDYFARSTQTRLDLPLFAVHGGEARALVTEDADGDYEITALLRSLRRDAEHLGTARCFTLLDIAQRLERSGAALCCAVRSADTAGNVPSARDGARAVLEDGYAVLKDGVLCAWLDREAALGTDLLLGYAGSADLVLPVGDGLVTVELRSCRPEFRQRGDVLYFSLEARAGIVECSHADPLGPETRAELDRALTEALRRCILAALTAETETGADFLELWRHLGQEPPADREAALRSLRWEASVTARVERSYDMEGAVAFPGEVRHG